MMGEDERCGAEMLMRGNDGEKAKKVVQNHLLSLKSVHGF